MNVTRCRRPLGCLKTSLRHARLQRSAQRSMSTRLTYMEQRGEPLPVPKDLSYRLVKSRNDPGFAVWDSLPSVRADPKTKNPAPTWEAKQLALLDPNGARARLFDRKQPDSAKVGDVLRVTTKTGEPFAGVCISIRRSGVDTAVLLRGQMFKVGVEMWYKIYSPHVLGIDIVWRRPKRARRARLFYMRKPKHDMGSVDDLVFAWKKERAALRGKKGQQGKQPLGMRF